MINKKITAATAEIMAQNIRSQAKMGKRLETIKALRVFARCKNIPPEGRAVFAAHATELEEHFLEKIQAFLSEAQPPTA